MFKLIIINLSIFATSFLLNKSCDCGNFETGIIKYSVKEGSSCCSGKFTNTHGSIGIYEYSEGAWMLMDVKDISNEDIEKTCCFK